MGSTTTAPAETAIAPAKPPKAAAANAVAAPWFVIDTTAQHGSARIHDQLIDGQPQAFTFERGKPLEMPAAIAIKFLRDPAFVRTDAGGKPMPYKRAPKQPEDLGAGERLILAEDETVARYDEMSTSALLQRVVELPHGEKFTKAAEKPAREDLIEFIVQSKKERRAASKAAPDVGRDDFVPVEDFDEEAA